MTAIEFRDKKNREIQELLDKLSSLDGTGFSAERSDRLFRTYQAQIERLTVFWIVRRLSAFVRFRRQPPPSVERN